MRRRHLVVIGAVLVVVVVVALAAVPPTVRALAVRQIEALTGRQAAVGDIELHLFARHLVLRDVRVAGLAGRPPLAHIARVDVRFHLRSLVRGPVELPSVAIAEPIVRLHRDEDGRLNIDDIVTRWRERPAAQPRPFDVDRLTMSGGRVIFDDAEADPVYVWEAGSVAIDAHALGTGRDHGRARLTFTVAGGRIGVDLTEISVRPLRAHFVAAASGLDIATVRRYIPADAPIALGGGQLASRVQGRYDAREGVAASGGTTVTDAVLVRGGEDAPFIRVPRATTTAREVTWRDGVARATRIELETSARIVDERHGPDGLEVGPVHAVLEGASYPTGPAARVTLTAGLPRDGRLEARGTTVFDPLAVALAVTVARAVLALARAYLPPDADVTIDGGRFAATLDLDANQTGLAAHGEFMITELALGRRGQAESFVRDERITGTLKDVSVRDGAIAAGAITLSGTPTIVDASRGARQRFELTRFTARVADAAWPARGPATVTADTELADGATASVRGSIHPQTLAARAEARVANFDVAHVASYIPANAPVGVAGGRVSARAELRHARDTGVTIDGTATIADLVLVREGHAGPFVTDPSLELSVTGLTLDDGAVRAARATATGTPRVSAPAPRAAETFDFTALRIEIADAAWPGPATARIEASATVEGGGRSHLAGSIELPALATRARATFTDVDMTRLNAWLPAGTAVAVASGHVDTSVDLTHDRRRGVVLNGDGVATGVALRRDGEPDPFLTDERVSFTVKDFVAKDDVLTAARVTATGSPTFIDWSVTPPRQFGAASMTAVAEDMQWPGDGPARVQVEATLPEGGVLTAEARARLASRTLEGSVSLRDVAAGAIARLLPIRAPVRGRLGGELTLAAAFAGDPQVHLRGTLNARQLEIGPEDGSPLTVAAVEATGVDLAWPPAVTIEHVVVREPSALIVRDPDGTFPLRRMLTPGDERHADAAKRGDDDGSPTRASTAASEASGDDARDVIVTVGRLEVEQGDFRFLDRAARPFFSEEVTQLRMTVEGLTNREDDRAGVRLHGIVGADAALALDGTIAPYGEPFHLELAGQLRGFDVPRTNPYLSRFLEWIATSGRLSVRVHYRVVGDRLEATNEVVVERLDMEPASEAPDRLVGLPLGLVVSLLKDSKGDIRVSVPLHGRLGSPQWDVGDAIGTAVRNVVTRLVTGPFRALGKIFQRGDGDGDGDIDVAIDPVLFEPGSAAVSAEGARQIQRVADFLRAAPRVRVALSAAVSEGDCGALRAQRVTSRVQRLQRQRGIDDFSAAARALYEREFPGQPPPPADDAVAVLANALPRPDPGIGSLAQRRTATAREALVAAAGIDPARIVARETPATIAADQGRVDFEILPER